MGFLLLFGLSPQFYFLRESNLEQIEFMTFGNLNRAALLPFFLSGI